MNGVTRPIFHTMLLLCVLIVSACNLDSLREKKEPSDGIYILSPHLSPDGQSVYFAASYKKHLSKLGSYDLKTNKLRVFFDLPVDRSWDTPVVSPDGTKIAVSSYCNPKHHSSCEDHQAGRQIVIIDRSTHKFRIITSGTNNYEGHSFSFTGDSLYAYKREQTRAWRKSIAKLGRSDPFPDKHELSNSGHAKLVEIDISNGQEKVLFPFDGKTTTAASSDRLSAVSSRKVLVPLAWFGGENGLVDYEKQLAAKKGNKGFALGFEYTIGKSLSPLSLNDEYDLGHLTASYGGEVLMFNDKSKSIPKTENGWFNYSLYVVRNGKVTELTSTIGYHHSPHISLNGEKIVVLSDPKRGVDWEMLIVDSRTGEVQKTGIRQKIATQIQREMSGPQE